MRVRSSDPPVPGGGEDISTRGEIFSPPVLSEKKSSAFSPSPSPRRFTARVSVSALPVRRYWQSPDSSFIPEWGRVSRSFDGTSQGRILQAELILQSFGKWPPLENELFLIQIDQDSPPPRSSHAQILKFTTSYSGQMALFQARRRNGQLELVELNPRGTWASASHPGQIDPAGQASCNERVCGMAWLRPGVYSYKGKSEGVVFNPLEDRTMSVARDSNGDGVVEANESLRSEKAFGFAIQIHAGLFGAPLSVGCQTLPPKDFQELRTLIDAAQQKTFSYILLRRPNDLTGIHRW